MNDEQLDRTTRAILAFAPPGHFYSPHPKIEDIEREHARTVSLHESLGGIDLNSSEQLALFDKACALAGVGPWTDVSNGEARYYYDNWFFRFGDANAVWHIAQLFRPRRIIEVGSGFSTACWLDTIDQLKLDASLYCVEPYPDRVHELCSSEDIAKRLELIERPVQAIPMDTFEQLGAGDVLFIDSTHVSKSGSDVNYLIFHVLPNLKPGVIVHIHDIFWPFEYPKEWYLEGRSWNECFILRAFLQFNSSFKILRFNSYLGAKHSEYINRIDPRFVSDSGGSIWLERV